MLGTLSKFFEYKIAALLHDPVDKAWIIVEHGGHEEAALKYASSILKGVGLAESIRSILSSVRELRSRHVVGYADTLASSIDRWVISILTTYRDIEGMSKYIKGVFEVRHAGKLKNIIDPRFYVALQKPMKEDVDEFINILGNLLVMVRGDIRLIYHLLYALYEPVFYDKVGSGYGGFVGSVADTRAPTHTVFDHAYATASMINLVYGLGGGEVRGKNVVDKLDGYIVIIDLASVQKFITASRKLRDLWLSSWLASALAWATVWPLIYALGPDIMVSPSPRNNPFYYSSLLAVLKSRYRSGNNINYIKEYFAKAVGKANKGIPRFGVMPTQVILLLPRYYIVKQGLKEISDELGERLREIITNTSAEHDGKEEDLIAELIVNIYKSLWNTIVEEVKESLLSGGQRSKLLEYVRRILEEYNCWSNDELSKVFDIIKDYPPLPIRVVVIDVKKILTDYLNKHKGLEEYEVYDILINSALSELRRSSTLKFSYPPIPPVEKLYETVTRVGLKNCGGPGLSRRGYEYCSVCGVMPAVLRMPSADEWDKVWKNKLGENAEILEPFISPGERLCIYDLVKRILSLNEVFNKTMKRIIHEELEPLDITAMPSTSHIALADLYDTLSKALVEAYRSKPKEMIENIDNSISMFIKNFVEKIEKIKYSTSYYEFLKQVEEKVKKEIKNEELLTLYEFIIHILDPELHILSREGRRALLTSRLRSNVRKILGKDLPLNIYYSIIRADADNMGKLLGGYINIALGIKPTDYFKEALEGDIRDIVELVFNGKLDEAEQRLASKYNGKVSNPHKVAEENILRLKKLVDLLQKRIPLTPAYHASISRSLMIAALVDQHIIEEDEKGFMVYSGGDDLLALAPISTSITAALKTRRTFSIGYYEGIGPKGFMDIDLLRRAGLTNYIVPLITTGGRSYSIVYVHYRYPLYIGLNISHELLEEKDYVEWIIDGKKFSKDIISIAYIPRGSGIIKTILPFKQRMCDTLGNDIAKCYRLGEVVEKINSSWKEVDEKIVSRSLIYDLQNNKETLRTILSSGNKELYYKFIEYIISRNVVQKVNVKQLNITNALKDYIDYKIEYKDKDNTKNIVFNVIDFFKIYDSAIRGVE